MCLWSLSKRHFLGKYQDIKKLVLERKEECMNVLIPSKYISPKIWKENNSICKMYKNCPMKKMPMLLLAWKLVHTEIFVDLKEEKASIGMESCVTPLYAAPEFFIWGMKPTTKADLYSFGVMLCEMISLRIIRDIYDEDSSSRRTNFIYDCKNE